MSQNLKPSTPTLYGKLGYIFQVTAPLQRSLFFLKECTFVITIYDQVLLSGTATASTAWQGKGIKWFISHR